MKDPIKFLAENLTAEEAIRMKPELIEKISKLLLKYARIVTS